MHHIYYIQLNLLRHILQFIKKRKELRADYVMHRLEGGPGSQIFLASSQHGSFPAGRMNGDKSEIILQ